MKYSIKEMSDGTHRLYRYDEDKGPPRNSEYQFWCAALEAQAEAEQLRARVAELEKDREAFTGPSMMCDQCELVLSDDE